MKTKLTALALAVMLVPALAVVQNKPILVVKEFTVVQGLSWPYDLKQLQAQTITELKVKDGQYFNVTDNAEEKNAASGYTLEGEVTQWHAGNRATRMLVGMGSGRETARIHYWLIDQTGKKVFEHTDTIRQAFWGNAYANSVGQLAQPFADKIAERLKEAKLTEGASTTNEPGPQSEPQKKVTGEKEKVGTVALNSVPDGAEVYIDGNFVGQAPATFQLPTGKHTIRVVLKNYKEWSRELSVLESSEVQLTATLEKQE